MTTQKHTAFYTYSSPSKPALEELISVQLSEGNNQFSEPSFHILPLNKAADYAQFLANVTQTKVRMVKPNSITDDVTTFSGKYFNPQN